MYTTEISEDFTDVSLFKLDSGLFYIKRKTTSNTLGYPPCNLKQAISHLYYLGVEEKEIYIGLSSLDESGDNFCSFGIFGSFIFSSKKEFHFENNLIVITKE